MKRKIVFANIEVVLVILLLSKLYAHSNLMADNFFKSNSFSDGNKFFNLKEYSDCLKEISEELPKEIKLDTTTPLFLDTSVLLRYYSLSFDTRKKLLNFINKNKDRIYITSQVQEEFIKNREEIIKDFATKVEDKVTKDFQSDVLNGIKSFTDTHTEVLKDFPDFNSALDKCKTELEDKLKALGELIDERRDSHLLAKDEFLELLLECKATQHLEGDDLKAIQEDFDKLKKSVEGKEKSVLNSRNLVFPGFSDIKSKDYPYGDFIIFMEMIKFMKDNNTNASFLTYDTTKGDWMDTNSNPHLHYLQYSSKVTGKLLFVLNATRSLNEILSANTDSLIDELSFLEYETNPVIDYVLALKKASDGKFIFYNDGINSGTILIDALPITLESRIETFLKKNGYSVQYPVPPMLVTMIYDYLIVQLNFLLHSFTPSEIEHLIVLTMNNLKQQKLFFSRNLD